MIIVLARITHPTSGKVCLRYRAFVHALRVSLSPSSGEQSQYQCQLFNGTREILKVKDTAVGLQCKSAEEAGGQKAFLSPCTCIEMCF